MNAANLLELLNGSAGTPEIIWLVMLTVYLSRESRTRGLRWYNWHHLPPNMDFVLAVFICDFGVCLRSVTIWQWRYFGSAGEFNALQSGILIFGGALIVVGSLCKIRSWTFPDFGRRPWLLATSLTIAVTIALLLFK